MEFDTMLGSEYGLLTPVHLIVEQANATLVLFGSVHAKH